MFLKRELKWKQTWKIYLNFDWAKICVSFYLYVPSKKAISTYHIFEHLIMNLKAKGELII